MTIFKIICKKWRILLQTVTKVLIITSLYGCISVLPIGNKHTIEIHIFNYIISLLH